MEQVNNYKIFWLQRTTEVYEVHRVYDLCGSLYHPVVLCDQKNVPRCLIVILLNGYIAKLLEYNKLTM